MKRRMPLVLCFLFLLLALAPARSQEQMGVFVMVLHDQNADSTISGGEPPLPGWTVFLDDNNNGVFDPGEESAVTDASGQVLIVTRKRCTTVRVQPPPNWAVTFPKPLPFYRICDSFEGLFAAAETEFDFGDLPDPPYRTLLVNNGPRHRTPGPQFGDARDSELDGLPDVTALGDDRNGGDDEDGIRFLKFEAGKNGQVEVAVKNIAGRAYVRGWVDFNGDGGFAPGELIVDVVVDKDTTLVFNFAVPADADWHGFSRFRIASDPVTEPIGELPDGEVEDLFAGRGEVDYGDALDHPLPAFPDMPFGYPTRLIDDGARHFPNPFVRLGASVTDGELDGRPSRLANGDDNFNLDDEDGIRFEKGFVTVFSGPDPDNATKLFTLHGVVRGLPVRLTPLATASGYLNLWIDWNRDGDWDDFGEQVYDDEPVDSGPMYTQLMFTIPDTAQIGLTFMRFRFSTKSGLGYTGGALDGEVEDHLLEIDPAADYGDAPRPYPTLRVDRGAWQIQGGYYLGAGSDWEFDGQPTFDATGDDSIGTNDDDGVVFLSSWVPGDTARVAVQYHTPDASKPGYLSAWVDFDRDSTWSDSTEKVIDAKMYSGTGSDTLLFAIPAFAEPGTTFVRFRFTEHSGSIGPEGPTPFDQPYIPGFGEIEDYAVAIIDTVSAVESLQAAVLPSTFRLSPAYPNPFNPRTTIRFSVPVASQVKVEVYSATGRLVAILVDEALAPGEYRVPFVAENLPSGVYFYRLSASGAATRSPTRLTRKMLLLR